MIACQVGGAFLGAALHAFAIRHLAVMVMESFQELHHIQEAAMIDRRSLLRALLSLGSLTVLLSACKHRSPYGSQDQPDSGSGSGGSYSRTTSGHGTAFGH